jgi:hypothetical protein
VVHCQIADLGRDLVRYVAGVEFADLAPHAAAAIEVYLQQLTQKREGGPGAGP